MNPTNPYDTIQQLREQVAAQAAVIELYEQALIASWPEGAMGDAFDYWNQARAATDSTQILDEVRREERERCAKVCSDAASAIKQLISEDPHNISNNFMKHRWSQSANLAESIRAME